MLSFATVSTLPDVLAVGVILDARARFTPCVGALSEHTDPLTTVVACDAGPALARFEVADGGISATSISATKPTVMTSVLAEYAVRALSRSEKAV